MNILIVEDDLDVKDILVFTIESLVEAEFILAVSGTEAIDVLENRNDIDLIFCDYNMPNGNGGLVYKYLLEKKKNIPYVFCSSDDIDEHEEFDQRDYLLSIVTKPNVFDGITESINKYEGLETTSEEEVVRNDNSYCHVMPILLRNLEKLSCDVFLKINDNKIIKVLKIGDSFSVDDLKKYEDKKLLIEREYVSTLVDNLFRKLEIVIESKSLKKQQKALDIHSVISSVVASLGLSEQVIRVTQQSIDYTITIFDKNKEFSEVYMDIFGHDSEYLTKHSIALAYVSTSLLSKTGWDSFENRNRMVLASFFHDISIRIPDFVESSKNELENISLKTFLEHPQEAVKILDVLKGIPQDVDKIILDHHEKPDGTGSPKGVSASQIKPLSANFIFCHDLVEKIFRKLDSDGHITQKELLKSIDSDLYSVGHFKKCLEAYGSLKLFKEE